MSCCITMWLTVLARFFFTKTVVWLLRYEVIREMLPEEIHQSRSPSSSSPASSSSCAVVWIPGSSPPAQMWGRSLVAASAVTQTLIYYVLYNVPINNWTFIGKYYFSTTVTPLWKRTINYTECAFIVYCKSWKYCSFKTNLNWNYNTLLKSAQLYTFK